MRWVAQIASIACFLAVSAQAVAGPIGTNVITNGNFDQSHPTASTQFGSAGYANLTGWTVTAVNGSTPFDLWWVASTAATTSALTQYGNSGQELFSSYPGASSASAYFVSLDGDQNARGVLSQTVSNLNVGDHYTLSFQWAATQMTTASQSAYTEQLAFNLGTSALTSTAGGKLTSMYSGAYKSSSGWQTVTYTFTATAATEVLSFLSSGTPVGGPPIALLDGISLIDTPEPSSLAVLGGALGLGAFLRRRQKRAA